MFAVWMRSCRSGRTLFSLCLVCWIRKCSPGFYPVHPDFTQLAWVMSFCRFLLHGGRPHCLQVGNLTEVSRCLVLSLSLFATLSLALETLAFSGPVLCCCGDSCEVEWSSVPCSQPAWDTWYTWQCTRTGFPHRKETSGARLQLA